MKRYRRAPLAPGHSPLLLDFFYLTELSGESDSAICARAGVTHNYINMLRSAQIRNPGVAALEALAGALDYELVLQKKGPAK